MSLKNAAKYLHISRRWLEDLILLGRIEAVQIESLQLIELDILKAFADKRKPKVSGWDRLDEWRK